MRYRNTARTLRIVEEQTDASIWSEARTYREAVLQAELRRLHASIEGDEDTVRVMESYIQILQERERKRKNADVVPISFSAKDDGNASA